MVTPRYDWITDMDMTLSPVGIEGTRHNSLEV